MKDTFVRSEFDTLEKVMGCDARSPEERKHEKLQRLVFEILVFLDALTDKLFKVCPCDLVGLLPLEKALNECGHAEEV